MSDARDPQFLQLGVADPQQPLAAHGRPLKHADVLLQAVVEACGAAGGRAGGEDGGWWHRVGLVGGKMESKPGHNKHQLVRLIIKSS